MKNGQPTQIKHAWHSRTLKRVILGVTLCSFVLTLLTGYFVQHKETELRENNLVNVARTLASTALSAGGDADDILLKVNDLLNVELVEGVRLNSGADTPLLVGSLAENFPPEQTILNMHTQWDASGEKMDIALKLAKDLPYDWLVLRLDAARLLGPVQSGTIINWVAAPIIAVLNGFIAFWLLTSLNLKPWRQLASYFTKTKGSYAAQALDTDLLKRSDEVGQISIAVEAMRTELTAEHERMEDQARLLQETPYALLRCSVNRKVLFANPAAKSEDTLFGDDTKEFVSPALSELVRKAFYESKQVYGDIRCKNYAITFRAIPVLDAGYVNLYGERIKRHEDMF